VSGGDVNTALTTLLSNITIGANGNWFVGDTSNPANDTGVKAQGPKGNSVADGDTFEIVNNLYEGGEGDALSAEMGKVLKNNILLTVAKVNELIGELAGIAYVGDPVSELSNLNWASTAPHAMFASGSGQHLELSGTFSGTTWTGKISVKSADAASYGLPFADDVTAMMGGSSKAITYDETTGDITITNMDNDVEITALATEIHGVDGSNNPMRWRMGKYFSNDSSKTPSQIVQTSADGAFSDYIPVSFVAGDVLEFDLGKYCFVANDYTTNPYIEFYGSDKSYIAHIGMNSENARSWTMPSGNNVLNSAYIRVSAYVPRIGAVYVKKNNSYYFKGDNL
jgi:hypothetical protein